MNECMVDTTDVDDLVGEVKEEVNEISDASFDDPYEKMYEEDEQVKTKFSLNPGKGRKKSNNRSNWKNV